MFKNSGIIIAIVIPKKGGSKMKQQYDEAKLKEIVKRRKELFKRKPEAAEYRPKVFSQHLYGLYTETKVRDHTVAVDYPEPAGGTDRAPNPIELLLCALAACIEAAIYEFAVYEGVKIDSISIEIEGSLDLRGLFMVDETVKPGFSYIKYVLNIKSKEDESKVRALVEKVIKHCPVVDSLSRPVVLKGEINIEKQREQ